MMSEVDHVAKIAKLETMVEYQDQAIERLNHSVDALTDKID